MEPRAQPVSKVARSREEDFGRTLREEALDRSPFETTLRGESDEEFPRCEFVYEERALRRSLDFADSRFMVDRKVALSPWINQQRSKKTKRVIQRARREIIECRRLYSAKRVFSRIIMMEQVDRSDLGGGIFRERGNVDEHRRFIFADVKAFLGLEKTAPPARPSLQVFPFREVERAVAGIGNMKETRNAISINPHPLEEFLFRVAFVFIDETRKISADPVHERLELRPRCSRKNAEVISFEGDEACLLLESFRGKFPEELVPVLVKH